MHEAPSLSSFHLHTQTRAEKISAGMDGFYIQDLIFPDRMTATLSGRKNSSKAAPKATQITHSGAKENKRQRTLIFFKTPVRNKSSTKLYVVAS